MDALKEVITRKHNHQTGKLNSSDSVRFEFIVSLNFAQYYNIY